MPGSHNPRRRLPHVELEDATYFVTWRLRDEPAPLATEERTVVASAVRHHAGERYRLIAYVVMDDHVHVLLRPHKDIPLAGIIHSWKSFTANRLQRQFARHGAVWQPGYFDRVIRGESNFAETIAYILNNPVKRWPEAVSYVWVWADEDLAPE